MNSGPQCPNCQSHSLMRVRRTRMDKLNRVQAKFRCQNCHESFVVRKPAMFAMDRFRSKIANAFK